jgi:uncharacterized protein involved in exopolysaccharide biosynthesis
MENQQYIQEDEIDLREYINVVIKRKKLVLGIFFSAVIISAIVSLLMPKVYEISSIIQLGSVNDFLIKKDEAKEMILNQNLLLSVVKELGLNIDVESLEKNIKLEDINNTNLLKIKIKHAGFDVACKINEAIINPLIARGQILYQERVAIVNDRLKELEAQIKSVEEDISRTQNIIAGLPASSVVSQTEASLRIILLQNTLPNSENSLSAFRNQRNDLRALLVNVKDFKIFESPIKPKYPVSPKKTQNVLISGIIGFLFGVFLAFFMEFWQSAKEVQTPKRKK